MHQLKKNTDYRIIVVQIAVPADEPESHVADAINETMREAMCMDDNLLHDYSIDFGGPVRRTDSEPEEGELLDPIARCA